MLLIAIFTAIFIYPPLNTIIKMNKKIPSLLATLCGVALASSAMPAADQATSAVTEEEQVEAVDYSSDYAQEDADSVINYYLNNSLPYPLHQAFDDYHNGQFDKIIADADSVLKLFPTYTDALYFKSAALMCKHDYEKSADCLVPQSFKTLDNRLYDLLEHQTTVAPVPLCKALEAVEQTVIDDESIDNSSKVMLYNLMGACYRRMGRNKLAATQIFPKAYKFVDSEDGKPYLLMCIASSWISAGNPGEALRVVKELEQINGETPYSSHIKAVALRNQGHIDKAIDLLDKKAKEDPSDMTICSDLGSFLTTAGKLDLAIKQFTDGLNFLAENDLEETMVNDRAELLLRRGIANKLKGFDAAANTDFNKILNLPDNGFRINAIARLGMVDELEKEMTDGNYSMTPISRAALYGSSGQDDKAMQWLAEAFKAQEISPDAVEHDINLRHLMKLPGYKEATKLFDGSK